MIEFGAALRAARESEPAAIPDVLATAATGIARTDVVTYLVDFSQTWLRPLPDRVAHAAPPEAEAVVSTTAGRAFTEQRVVTAERDGGIRVWVPVLEGSDRTGIIALTLPTIDDEMLASCEDLGHLAGYLIATHARCTDLYRLRRGAKRTSMAASMQRDLLPPVMVTTGTVALAGFIEPADDVGGDCFDYSVNGLILDFAVMDALGRGVAAPGSTAASGSYCHNRREGRSLKAMHTTLSETLATHDPGGSFATGILGPIELDAGVLTWTPGTHHHCSSAKAESSTNSTPSRRLRGVLPAGSPSSQLSASSPLTACSATPTGSPRPKDQKATSSV